MQVIDKMRCYTGRLSENPHLTLTLKVGSRILKLTGGTPCELCSRPPQPSETRWGVQESLRWEYELENNENCSVGTKNLTIKSAKDLTRTLISGSTLYEAQAVYAATLQAPVPPLPRDIFEEIIYDIISQAKTP